MRKLCGCLFYNQNYYKRFDENVKEKHFNIYKFSNYGTNKFILLLWKGVYPYKHMGDLENYNETSLPEKEVFYSHVNMEDITDADYTYTKQI